MTTPPTPVAVAMECNRWWSRYQQGLIDGDAEDVQFAVQMLLIHTYHEGERHGIELMSDALNEIRDALNEIKETA